MKTIGRQSLVVATLGLGMGSAACGSTTARPEAAGVCQLLSDATVQQLNPALHGPMTQSVQHIAKAQTRCAYQGEGGAVLLDVYQYDDAATARQRMSNFGEIVTSESNTASPFGTDQLNAFVNTPLPKELNGYTSMFGIAARHDRTIVTINLIGSLSKQGAPADRHLHELALETAGAQLTAWPAADICQRVPALAVQSLVALGNAKLLSHEKKALGATNSCYYVFSPYDNPGSWRAIAVMLGSTHYLNQDEVYAAAGSKGQASPFLRGDGNDEVFPPGPEHVLEDVAYGLHGGELGRVQTYGGEESAQALPGYNLHLEQAALLAAGASVSNQTATMKIAPAREASSFESARHSVARFIAVWWIFGLVIPVPVWALRNRYQRRKLLRTGLPGTALVRSVSDMGMSMNNSYLVRIRATITPQGGTPYEASSTMFVGRMEAPATWVGKAMQVRIDRKNPKRFIFG